jgi:hypothetical protein
MSALVCLAALGLGSGCGAPASPPLTFQPENPESATALGLESFVDLLPQWQDGKTTRYHPFERSTLELATRGGAEVLWTEVRPDTLMGRPVHRIHYRCGPEASASQHLDVTVTLDGGEQVAGTYDLPCKAATSFRFTQGLEGPYLLGVNLFGIPELRAGSQKLEGRGIQLVSSDGPLFATPGAANHPLYVRTVRPGTAPRFRAGPLELTVPITVYPDDVLTFRITRSPSTYDGVEVMGFEGQMFTSDGQPVYGARDCQPTVTPASAEYTAPHSELCTRYTLRGQPARVCMTFRGQSACEDYTP